jgi:FkbM family methyltransferase
MRNVIFPYLLSFLYRIRKMRAEIYDIRVKSTGMRFKMRLRVTGECCFPIVDTILLRRLGRYEPETSMTLASMLRPGSTVLELGAAEGYFSVQMSKFVGETGYVYSFEPNHEFYEDCLCNLRLNGCRNVVVKNEGLGRESQELVDGNGRHFRTGSLMEFLRSLERPLDFVFIDVDAKTPDSSEARQELELIKVLCEYVSETKVQPTIFLEYILNDVSFLKIVEKLAATGYAMDSVTKRHFLFQKLRA